MMTKQYGYENQSNSTDCQIIRENLSNVFEILEKKISQTFKTPFQ